MCAGDRGRRLLDAGQYAGRRAVLEDTAGRLREHKTAIRATLIRRVVCGEKPPAATKSRQAIGGHLLIYGERNGQTLDLAVS